MGVVLGPFDADDWYELGQLKYDLEFTEKNLKDNPDYEISRKWVKNRFNSIVNKRAA
jgi:hypothetical protein